MINEYIRKLRSYALQVDFQRYKQMADDFMEIAEYMKSLPVESKWIPCSEELPVVEEEVLILAKRKWRGGGFKYVVTTAIYEDGTMRENDSIWSWQDIDGELDEEEDCYIIPEGWWEYRHYNPDDVYNNAVDDKVIAWQPLPEPYKE